MLHLFTVTDTFQIEQRGSVLVLGLSTEPGEPIVHRDARIRLRTPAGKEIDTSVRAIVMISYRKKPEKIRFPVLLPKDIAKEDVPIGAEVPLLKEIYETV